LADSSVLKAPPITTFGARKNNAVTAASRRQASPDESRHKGTKQMAKPRKYGVMVQWYSLEQNEVGKPLGDALVSAHHSLRAAGRVLGSLISGKLAKFRYEHGPKGAGVQIYAFDFESGKRFARNDCPR
jgi:hypothetical protein